MPKGRVKDFRAENEIAIPLRPAKIKDFAG
jgi:hypothetical protein